MYTSILVFALSGLAPSAEAGRSPAWLTDYTAAGIQSASAKKPLAVFLASGKAGYDKLSREGKLPVAAAAILESKYVCLHVDTSTEQGKRLAELFEVPEGLGVVISDRAGDVQAFRHEGSLANGDLVRYLKRYADPNLVVRTTESNPGIERVSYYGAGNSPATAYSAGYCRT